MPNDTTLGMFDSDFLAQLESIRLNLRQRLTSGISGGKISNQKGQSLEFSDFKEYQIGDDYRRVDWNAYARFDKLILKLFMEEKQLNVSLLLDISESMNAGEVNKLLFAKKICAVIAYLTLVGYDQVSIYLLGDGISQVLPALSGKQSFIKILDFLQNAKTAKQSNISHAVRQINFKAKGACVLLSDGFVNDDLAQALSFLQYKKQNVFFVQILSAEELNPSLNGRFRLVDSENKEALDVTCNESVLSIYHKTLTNFLNNIHALCSKNGMQYTLISSDTDFKKAIFEKLLPVFQNNSEVIR